MREGLSPRHGDFPKHGGDGHFAVEKFIVLDVNSNCRLSTIHLLATNDTCATADAHVVSKSDLRRHH